MSNNTGSGQQETLGYAYACNMNPTCDVQILQGVGYFPLFPLGLVLNLAALCAIVAKRACWTDTHVYTLNLVVADLALILFLPARIADAFVCLERSRLCTFLISTHYVNMYASIMTVTAISVHRYLAVCLPLRARAWGRSKKKAAGAVCAVIWVALVSICVGFKDSNHPTKLFTCYERCADMPLDFRFLVVLEVLGYLVPLLIMVFCSTKTILTLLKENEGEDPSARGEKNMTRRIVTANMVVFIVCYTPVHFMFLLKYLVKSKHWSAPFYMVDLFWQVSEWIATTNCCLDSISYYYLLKHFYVDSKRLTDRAFFSRKPNFEPASALRPRINKEIIGSEPENSQSCSQLEPENSQR